MRIKGSSRSAGFAIVSSILSLAWASLLSAGVVRNVTDLHAESVRYDPTALDDAGTVAFAVSGTGEFVPNPPGTPQIVRWDIATGTGARLTSFDNGVLSVSASDDGQWLAFRSTSNPTGRNPDEGPELFVMRSDGTGLAQLTTTAAGAGSFLSAVISGNAERIAFVASSDPLGSNPAHEEQVFVVGRDGSGLRQLTSDPPGGDAPWSVGMSDDGERAIFIRRDAADFLQVYGVNADGTDLHALTANTEGSLLSAVISGNGETIAFCVATPELNLRVVGWDGSGLALLGPGCSPAITDDGAWIFFVLPGSDTTPDEIRKIRSDGTGLTILSAAADPRNKFAPRVSGAGGRVVFTIWGGAYPGESNLDGSDELMAMDSSGSGLIQLSALDSSSITSIDDSDIAADGSRIFWVAVDDHDASPPLYQVYRLRPDGTDLARVTNEPPGTQVWDIAAAPDGSFVVYNLWPDLDLYKIDADGTGKTLLSPAGTFNLDPVLSKPSAGISWVVFHSNYNGGSNPDGSPELFRRRTNLTALGQLTNDNDSCFKWPRIDDAGTWVVYSSCTNIDGLNADRSQEIFRVPVAGGPGLQQRLTANAGYDSIRPDISGDGTKIVWASEADPLGTNADHNFELFLYEPAGPTLRQLTNTSDGESDQPRINQDGSLVYFVSSSSIFEPATDFDAYRIVVATGVIERVGGLGAGGAIYDAYRHETGISIDRMGTRAVWAGYADSSGDDHDRSGEVWLADYGAPARLRVGKGAPTRVSWDVEPKPRRYDVVRGDVASLAGGSVLQPITCLADDLADDDTDDPLQPAAGQVLYYLQRGSQGNLDGPGSWGSSSSGERIVGAGSCP